MPAPARSRASAARTIVLVSTRKGLWSLSSDATRQRWTLGGPRFLGHNVHHAMVDPRDPRHWLATARTGHLGPTVFRSANRGRAWVEAAAPPAFRPGSGRTVDHNFWLTPGHESESGCWYVGTSPQGLFRTTDHGATWTGVTGFNEHPERKAWCGGDQDGTPDGPKLHSILVDPRDRKHLYIAMSSGGVFESIDAGGDWTPLNRGVRADFLPEPTPAFGHDPHCVRFAGGNPDRLWQQNHCGLYRLDRPSTEWADLGEGMPKSVGTVGFPMVAHPRDPDSAWIFPMDGSDVWPRTSPGGRPAAYRTSDGGRTWKRLDGGLPRAQAWWTVKRQAMTQDARDPVGLYFGTTSGEVWASRDEGRTWRLLVRNLPQIHAVEAIAA